MENINRLKKRKKERKKKKNWANQKLKEICDNIFFICDSRTVAWPFIFEKLPKVTFFFFWTESNVHS